MAKVRNCVWVSPSSILTIAHNLFRQFLNVTFNEIFCILALFLFYGTPAEYIASGNSWWLLWPKCWLETEFDFRFRLRFSQFNQVNQTNCDLLWTAKKFLILILFLDFSSKLLKNCPPQKNFPTTEKSQTATISHPPG